MEIKTFSYYQSNIPCEVVRLQRAVFDKFGVNHFQVRMRCDHPSGIDWHLHDASWNTVFLFDIDCIPLSKSLFELSFEATRGGNTLFGAAQRCVGMDSADYVSPAFMVLTKAVWEKLGRPSFHKTRRSDVGGELTELAHERSVETRMLRPTHVSHPRWALEDGTQFGLGTNYENLVYHAFESRCGGASTSLFAAKCREVLGHFEYA